MKIQFLAILTLFGLSAFAMPSLDALTGAGALVMWFGADQVCGGRFSIGACRGETLALLAFSIPAVSLLRGVVLMKLAKGGQKHSLLLLIPLIIFAAYELASGPSTLGLAGDFTVFSWSTLAYYALACRLIK